MNGWLERLSGRERRLLALAAAAALAIGAGALALAVRDDLATLRARVAGHERELAEVRRLAGALGHETPAPTADTGSLLGRLEAAAEETVGHERIASMTPVPGEEARVALRVTDAALGDVVRLLHALEAGSPPLGVARLELRKHPDRPARFDATLEAAAP